MLEITINIVPSSTAIPTDARISQALHDYYIDDHSNMLIC